MSHERKCTDTIEELNTSIKRDEVYIANAY